MGKLEGKVAVVTGAASGIGEAIARLFAQEGARVVLADIEVEKGQMVAAHINELYPERALFVLTDVTKEEQIKRLIEDSVEAYNHINIMVNCAGIAPRQMFLEEYDRDVLQRMLSIHLEGVFYGMKYAIPVMCNNCGSKQSGSEQSSGKQLSNVQGNSTYHGALNGVIINISSNAAVKAFRGNSLYSAAKAGVLQLTKVAALEHAKDGIRVNAICPGITYTGMVRRAIEAADDPAEFRRSLEHAQPIPGIIPPEKTAAAALYLASDDASFVTGVVLPVDGGSVL